uniref:Reverse transcriptase domain-containing protein n=1 Tax=Sander lucioperca TaxID=283035 RepID=A0A8C9X250_SANLU
MGWSLNICTVLLGVCGQMTTVWIDYKSYSEPWYIGTQTAVMDRHLLSIKPPGVTSTMSKQSTIEDCGAGPKQRGSQRSRTTTTNVLAADAANNIADTQQADLAAVLSELQSLRTTVSSINTKISAVDNFGNKLDSVEKRIMEMNGSVAAVQRSFADLKADIIANDKRLTEAEDRIGTAEDGIERVKLKLTDAVKRIAYLESKTEDLENRGRRKNLRLVGLPESATKTRPMVEFIQHMLPIWLDAFLDHLQFQVLTEEARKELDNDITEQELLQAIKSVNSGKVPGPDGLPIEFYKTFRKHLLIPLLNMFNESFDIGNLPPTLRLATITLILKPGKASTDCSSYRPISLMGVDTKILCKVLARRLDPYVPFLVHDDQNGFVRSRQGFHNIRRVLNIIHCNNNARDNALLSLDARQAFDRIEWPYLFNVLPRYGIGGKTNNNLSSQITLERSTRQGCPLSPLLFVLAIEPLAISIRNEANLSGITIGDQEHRISLYADDVILFLSKLSTSIPAILQLINRFGKSNPVIRSPFFNARERFTYLGVKITPQINKIVKANYDPLMGEVRESIGKWTTMPISLIGQINLIKMVILPKFLYLFQSLPLPLPNLFCKEINKILCRFIWNNRKSRLRLRLLYLPYDRGGLQMPSLQWYYWAAQLRCAMFYFLTRSPPAWVSIEQTISKLPLRLYLYSTDPKTLKKQTINPFLKNTIDIWFKAHKHIGDTPPISQFCTLLQHKWLMRTYITPEMLNKWSPDIPDTCEMSN